MGTLAAARIIVSQRKWHMTGFSISDGFSLQGRWPSHLPQSRLGVEESLVALAAARQSAWRGLGWDSGFCVLEVPWALRRCRWDGTHQVDQEHYKVYQGVRVRVRVRMCVFDYV